MLRFDFILKSISIVGCHVALEILEFRLNLNLLQVRMKYFAVFALLALCATARIYAQDDDRKFCCACALVLFVK